MPVHRLCSSLFYPSTQRFFAFSVLCALCGTAWAETAYEFTAEPTRAQIVETPVQWTPETVTVIGRDEIDAMYRLDVESLEGFAPGLLIDRNSMTARGANIAIRGIGSSNAEAGIEPAIATYVDGVYLANQTGTLRSLFDMERVEVFRGPNTSYNPAPNLGGAIAYTRTRPTGELGVDLRLAAASLDRQELGVVINLPSFADISTKLAINSIEGGGDYMRNLVVAREENNDEYTSISFSALWPVMDNLTVQYTFDTEDDDSPTPALLNISGATDLVCSSSLNDANCRSSIGVNIPQLLTLNNTAQNYSNQRSVETESHTVRIDFEWANTQFTSITGFRDTDEANNQDLDATDVDFYSVTGTKDHEQYSQELRATGNISDTLSYAAGLYVLETEYSLNQEEFYVLSRLSDSSLSTSFHGPGEVQQLSSMGETSLQSVFVHFNQQLSEQWQGDIGARYYYVEKDFNHSPLGVRLGTGIVPSPVVVQGTSEWDEYTVSAGVSFKVDEEAMLYARFNQGFRPGGFDENAVSAESGRPFDAEESTSWEVGIKSEWFNDALRLNANYFQTQYKNKREQFLQAFSSSTGAIETVTSNASRSDSRGFDVEFEYLAMSNLYFRGGLSNLSSEIGSYDIPDLANPGMRLDLSSLPAQWAPDNSVFISGRYSIDVYGGTVSAYAGFRLNSGYQTNTLVRNSEVFSYSTWDLAVDYQWRDLTIRAFSHNVNDKRYIQNATRITDGNIGPHVAGTTAATGLVTYTEYNQPKISGLEFIYKPDLGKMLGR